MCVYALISIDMYYMWIFMWLTHGVDMGWHMVDTYI